MLARHLRNDELSKPLRNGSSIKSNQVPVGQSFPSVSLESNNGPQNGDSLLPHSNPSSMTTVTGKRSLLRPGIYPQEPNQKEDDLSGLHVKQGFTRCFASFVPSSDEHGSMQFGTNSSGSPPSKWSNSLINDSTNNGSKRVLSELQSIQDKKDNLCVLKNTCNTTSVLNASSNSLTSGNQGLSNTKHKSFSNSSEGTDHRNSNPNAQPIIKRVFQTKDHFWLVTAKNRGPTLDNWFQELKLANLLNGKPLHTLSKQVPIFSKKEELLSALFEFSIPSSKAIWLIQMTAAYHIQSLTESNKAKRRNQHIFADITLEWTQTLVDFTLSQWLKLVKFTSEINFNRTVEAEDEFKANVNDTLKESKNDSVLRDVFKRDVENSKPFKMWKYLINLIIEMDRSARLIDHTLWLNHILHLFKSISSTIIINQNCDGKQSDEVKVKVEINDISENCQSRNEGFEKSGGNGSMSCNHLNMFIILHHLILTHMTLMIRSEVLSRYVMNVSIITINYIVDYPELFALLTKVIQFVSLNCSTALVWRSNKEFQLIKHDISGYPSSRQYMMECLRCESPLDNLPDGVLLNDLPFGSESKVVKQRLLDVETEVEMRSLASVACWSGHRSRGVYYQIERDCGNFDYIENISDFEFQDLSLHTLDALSSFNFGSFNGNSMMNIDPDSDDNIIHALSHQIFEKKRKKFTIDFLSLRGELAEFDDNVEQLVNEGDEVILRTMFDWSIHVEKTSSSLHNHKPYVVAKILASRQSKLMSKKSNDCNKDGKGDDGGGEIPLFQEQIYTYLDRYAPYLRSYQNDSTQQDLNKCEFGNVILLITQLCSHSLFSYHLYISRLIRSGHFQTVSPHFFIHHRNMDVSFHGMFNSTIQRYTTSSRQRGECCIVDFNSTDTGSENSDSSADSNNRNGRRKSNDMSAKKRKRRGCKISTGDQDSSFEDSKNLDSDLSELVTQIKDTNHLKDSLLHHSESSSSKDKDKVKVDINVKDENNINNSESEDENEENFIDLNCEDISNLIHLLSKHYQYVYHIPLQASSNITSFRILKSSLLDHPTDSSNTEDDVEMCHHFFQSRNIRQVLLFGNAFNRSKGLLRKTTGKDEKTRKRKLNSDLLLEGEGEREFDVTEESKMMKLPSDYIYEKVERVTTCLNKIFCDCKRYICYDIKPRDSQSKNDEKRTKNVDSVKREMYSEISNVFSSLSIFDQHRIITQFAVKMVDCFTNVANTKQSDCKIHLPRIDDVRYMFHLIHISRNVDLIIEFSILLLKQLNEISVLFSSHSVVCCTKPKVVARLYVSSVAYEISNYLRNHETVLCLDLCNAMAVFDKMCRVVLATSPSSLSTSTNQTSNSSSCSSNCWYLLAYLHELGESCHVLKSSHAFQIIKRIPFFTHNSNFWTTLLSLQDSQTSSNTLLSDNIEFKALNDKLGVDVLQTLKNTTASVNHLDWVKSDVYKRVRENQQNRFDFVLNVLRSLLSASDYSHLRCISLLACELTTLCNNLTCMWLSTYALICNANTSLTSTDLIQYVLTPFIVSDGGLKTVDKHTDLVRVGVKLAYLFRQLISHQCFTLQSLAVQIVIPSLLKAWEEMGKEGLSVETEVSTRITCILFILSFQTEWGESSVPNGMRSEAISESIYLKFVNSNITVGAIVAVLKAVLVLSEVNSHSESSNEQTENCKKYLKCELNDVTQVPTIPVLANHILTQICGEGWIQDRCLQVSDDLLKSGTLLDPMLSRGQAYKLLRLIGGNNRESMNETSEDDVNKDLIIPNLNELNAWNFNHIALEFKLLQCQLSLKQGEGEEQRDGSEVEIEIKKRNEISLRWMEKFCKHLIHVFNFKPSSSSFSNVVHTSTSDLLTPTLIILYFVDQKLNQSDKKILLQVMKSEMERNQIFISYPNAASSSSKTSKCNVNPPNPVNPPTASSHYNTMEYEMAHTHFILLISMCLKNCCLKIESLSDSNSSCRYLQNDFLDSLLILLINQLNSLLTSVKFSHDPNSRDWLQVYIDVRLALLGSLLDYTCSMCLKNGVNSLSMNGSNGQSSHHGGSHLSNNSNLQQPILQPSLLTDISVLLVQLISRGFIYSPEQEGRLDGSQSNSLFYTSIDILGYLISRLQYTSSQMGLEEEEKTKNCSTDPSIPFSNNSKHGSTGIRGGAVMSIGNSSVLKEERLRNQQYLPTTNDAGLLANVTSSILTNIFKKVRKELAIFNSSYVNIPPSNVSSSTLSSNNGCGGGGSSGSSNCQSSNTTTSSFDESISLYSNLNSTVNVNNVMNSNFLSISQLACGLGRCVWEITCSQPYGSFFDEKGNKMIDQSVDVSYKDIVCVESGEKAVINPWQLISDGCKNIFPLNWNWFTPQLIKLKSTAPLLPSEQSFYMLFNVKEKVRDGDENNRDFATLQDLNAFNLRPVDELIYFCKEETESNVSNNSIHVSSSSENNNFNINIKQEGFQNASIHSTPSSSSNMFQHSNPSSSTGSGGHLITSTEVPSSSSQLNNNRGAGLTSSLNSNPQSYNRNNPTQNLNHTSFHQQNQQTPSNCSNFDPSVESRGMGLGFPTPDMNSINRPPIYCNNSSQSQVNNATNVDRNQPQTHQNRSVMSGVGENVVNQQMVWTNSNNIQQSVNQNQAQGIGGSMGGQSMIGVGSQSQTRTQHVGNTVSVHQQQEYNIHQNQQKMSQMNQNISHGHGQENQQIQNKHQVANQFLQNNKLQHNNQTTQLHQQGWPPSQQHSAMMMKNHQQQQQSQLTPSVGGGMMPGGSMLPMYPNNPSSFNHSSTSRPPPLVLPPQHQQQEMSINPVSAPSFPPDVMPSHQTQHPQPPTTSIANSSSKMALQNMLRARNQGVSNQQRSGNVIGQGQVSSSNPQQFQMTSNRVGGVSSNQFYQHPQHQQQQQNN